MHHECRQRILELEEQLRATKAENNLLCCQLATKEEKVANVSNSRALLDFMHSSGIELRRPALRTALLLRAETLVEAAQVEACKNALHVTGSAFRSLRRRFARQADPKSAEDLRPYPLQENQMVPTSDYFVLVFGKNALRCRTERMLFFANEQMELDGARLVCAFADGKFSACPKKLAPDLRAAPDVRTQLR